LGPRRGNFASSMVQQSPAFSPRIVEGLWPSAQRRCGNIGVIHGCSSQSRSCSPWPILQSVTMGRPRGTRAHLPQNAGPFWIAVPSRGCPSSGAALFNEQPLVGASDLQDRSSSPTKHTWVMAVALHRHVRVVHRVLRGPSRAPQDAVSRRGRMNPRVPGRSRSRLASRGRSAASSPTCGRARP